MIVTVLGGPFDGEEHEVSDDAQYLIYPKGNGESVGAYLNQPHPRLRDSAWWLPIRRKEGGRVEALWREDA